MPEQKPVNRPALQAKINAMKRDFMAFSQRFGALQQNREELAPKFMALYGEYQQREGGGRFVDFVREFDPSVPTDREGYRRHKSYNAADYLRRLTNRPAERRGMAVRSSLLNLARTLATILQIAKDKTAIWKAVEQEFDLRPRQVTNLKKTVLSTQPLFKIESIKKPVEVVVIPLEAERAAEADSTMKALQETAASLRKRKRPSVRARAGASRPALRRTA